jgi:thymidylate synthase (FAD)
MPHPTPDRLEASMSDDSTGFGVIPKRYATDSGREAIDLIRDSMSDHEFVVYCRGQAMKYRLRLGKKDSDDAAKASWYEQMAAHVSEGAPDPRHQRPGFEGYRRFGRPEPLTHEPIPVLDHGFVRLVETWGDGDTRLPEAGIIEAARQSTQGSFRGWDADRKLLQFLHSHKHATPFEFAGMVIEVRAPIFVFREWHRHRTQSYNEMSARYAPLPDVAYVPTVERLMMGVGTNRQASAAAGAAKLTERVAERFRVELDQQYRAFAEHYTDALAVGVPKELARLAMPVGRYSQMRASTSLRNWLGFLTLRLDPAAQWEIRQYAEAVLVLVRQHFPQTAALFEEGGHA